MAAFDDFGLAKDFFAFWAAAWAWWSFSEYETKKNEYITYILPTFLFYEMDRKTYNAWIKSILVRVLILDVQKEEKRNNDLNCKSHWKVDEHLLPDLQIQTLEFLHLYKTEFIFESAKTQVHTYPGIFMDNIFCVIHVIVTQNTFAVLLRNIIVLNIFDN